MTIIRDDCDERQIRVDRMCEEFRKAQSRRPAKATTAKGDGKSVESPPDVDAQPAAAPSTATPGASR